MGFGDRLKTTFSRGSNFSTNTSSSTSSASTKDPSDRTTSLWYQPGEKIPYKYRRPVEPAHKAKLDSFSWAAPWKRRKSNQSQYSPMGSRMPSLSGPRVRRSMDIESIGPTEASYEDHLETIQSVQTGSHDDIPAESQQNDTLFTMEQLQKAMEKAGTS